MTFKKLFNVTMHAHTFTPLNENEADIVKS